VEYADIVLTKSGIKYLLIETKRLGALAWNQRTVEKALEQSTRYAANFSRRPYHQIYILPDNVCGEVIQGAAHLGSAETPQSHLSLVYAA